MAILKGDTMAFEDYTGVMESGFLRGEVTLSIGKTELTAVSAFDTAVVSYADITAIEYRDWAAHLQTDRGPVKLSRMGRNGERFYDDLCAAYNKKVLAALFVAGGPLIETIGEYRAEEGGRAFAGRGVLQVYGNCVCVLPPNEDARRIPLCFLADMRQEGFVLALTLDTGERYSVIRLGRDTDPFEAGITEQLRKMRDKALAVVRQMDPALPAMQAAAIAKCLPEGVAAPLGQLAAIAPSFVKAVERKIGESSATASYAAFRELCDPAQICVGLKKQFARGGGGEATADAPEGTQEEDLEEELMLWMIAPGKNGRTAAVEFGEADAATFLYRYDCGWDSFRQSLNLALEAIAFRREGIRLRDAELLLPQYDTYKMAARRNAALQFVRGCYAGRVIHASPEKWKRNVAKHLE